MTRSLTFSTAIDSPEVLVTPTQDEGKLIAALHGIKQGGEADLSTGVQVAQVRSCGVALARREC